MGTFPDSFQLHLEMPGIGNRGEWMWGGFKSKKNESHHYKNCSPVFGHSMCPINYLKNRTVLGTWNMGSWAASCQVMAQGSGLPDIQDKNLSAFCLSRGISWNFWRECKVREKKRINEVKQSCRRGCWVSFQGSSICENLPYKHRAVSQNGSLPRADLFFCQARS